MSRVRDRATQRALHALRRPVVARRRRRLGGLDPLSRSMLEAVGYRRSMLDFMGAIDGRPDILVEADLPPGATVVDGGAYRGEWAAEVLAHHPGCRIVAFEPSPHGLTAIDERLGTAPGLTVVPVALGRADGQGALVVPGPGSRVLLGPHDRGTPVRIRDVVAVLDELGVAQIDLAKLNIEGGEFDVLERLAEAGRLELVDDLIVQFHDWHPGAPARRRRLRRELARTHDEVWNYPWVWERWRRRRPGRARPGGRTAAP